MKIEINNLPKELNGLKIVHVSDVHLPKNANSIDGIVRLVKEQKPDIIVMTGDMIDSSDGFKKDALDKLCKGLSGIAKTYAVTGNHEVLSGCVEEWTQILTNNNIEVIDNKISIYTKNNKSLGILGLKEGYKYNSNNFSDIDKTKEMPVLLLSHRPEMFEKYFSDINTIKPDLVITGHAHGGQARIPIINKGIIAPNQGFFPKYSSGIYESSSGGKMVVSRGLGNSIIPLRINNRPHLPVIELVGK